MKPEAKLKTAMDETRLLILGAQILLGFQLNGMFQEGFDSLGSSARALDVAAFVLIAVTVALLIAPSMHHRIAERGEATARIHRIATTCAGFALLPLAATLSLDLSIVLHRHHGSDVAAAAGVTFFIIAMALWFAFAWLKHKPFPGEDIMSKSGGTPLHAKVEQMLTEARVLIPGAQALLGFQMAVMFTSAFDRLPASSKLTHTAALCCMALAIIILIAPAAIHRLSYHGEDSEEFHRLGSLLVVLAAIPLTLGITLDLFVAARKATESESIALITSSLSFLIMAVLWFVYPLASEKSPR
jgi:hypothetical protein